VTNDEGSTTSNEATLTVTAAEAPSIVTHPADQSVTEGDTATFSVTAEGAAPLTYQWQKNQEDIDGATSASYTTPTTTLADDGSKFRCVVTNDEGSSTSNEAALTVSEAAQAPSIVTHPADQSVTEDDTATFTVAAEGTAPLTYQWQKNQEDIDGATSASYTTPATTLDDDGSKFRCVVTNDQGRATSNEATLTVSEAENQPPAAPELTAPDNGATGVSLTPTLTTGDFDDPDGDVHAKTQWQISANDSFAVNALVLDVRSASFLTSLEVPGLVLDGETTYY
jgi:hypothetical protein